MSLHRIDVGSPLHGLCTSPGGGRRVGARGFTLVELMVVVALVMGVAGMGVWTLSGITRVQQSADLARGIAFMMMRAHGDAVADGFQRRVTCTPTQCALVQATTAGMAAPAGYTTPVQVVYAGSQTAVFDVEFNTLVGPFVPGAQFGGARSIDFFPDGTATATGATVFVNDARNARRYKIFVYPATGLSRIVDSW